MRILMTRNCKRGVCWIMCIDGNGGEDGSVPIEMVMRMGVLIEVVMRMGVLIEVVMRIGLC